jgi:thermitase
MTRSISAALLAALLTLSAGPAAAALSVPRLPGGAETVPGELIVKFKPGTSAQGQAAALTAVGHSTIGTLGDLGAEGWVHVRVAPGQTDAQALAAYAGDASVEFAQPNFIYRASAVPNDPQYSQLWGWKNSGQTVTTAATQPPSATLDYLTHNPGTAGSDMNLEKAWDRITDCSSVVVAVIDSGVNYSHVDLAANMWNGTAQHGKNFSTDVTGTDPMDLNGHGTHVAGTIGAVGNNSIGVTGVCWKATIMAVRVLGADGSGTSAGIIQGIDYAVQNGAKVLNMSLGGGGSPDPAYSAAITRAQMADVVVVVAAGNDGKDNETTAVYPCNFPNPNLICVAALDQAFSLASFSNWGATSVDVGAPGTNIVNTWPGPVMEDPLTAGWSGASTTTGGGWAYAVNGTINLVAVPIGFAGPTYNNSTNDRAWKAYNLTGMAKAVLKFSAVIDVAANDIFRIAARNGVGDPFVAAAMASTPAAGYSNWPNFEPLAFEITPCISASCTIGLQLQSDGVPQTARGVGVAFFTLHGIQTPAVSYNTENGTSMASPAVAGLATMLRAFHGPTFTAAEVVGAIKGGGRATAALVGKTTSGKAADAMGSLAFINPPTGLTAVVR